MPDRKLLFFPISTSPMSGIYQQAKIIILEILQCIPVVIIFAFLDLEKISSFRSDTDPEHPEITLHLTAQVSILWLNIVPTPVYNILIAAN